MKNKLLYRVIPFFLILSMVVLCLPAVPAHAATYELPAVPVDEYSVLLVYMTNSTGLIQLYKADRYKVLTNGALAIYDFNLYHYDPDSHSWVFQKFYSSSLSVVPTWTSVTYLVDPSGILPVSDTVIFEQEMVAESILFAGQWECNSSIMTGEYSDLTAWPSGLGSVDLSFASAGGSFSKMSCTYDIEVSHGYCIYYDDTFAYSYGLTNTGFDMDAFGQIYLPSNQSVNQVFYDWFTANFTYLGNEEITPSYSTVINIYNTTGSGLLASYSLSGDSYAPFAEGKILANGLQMSDGSGDVWSWTEAGDLFNGFSLQPNSVLVAYGPGATFIAGGYPADFVLDLYLAADPSDEEVYHTGVLGWLERMRDMLRDGLQNILDALKPSWSSNFLGIIDFSAIGEFFSNAYGAVKSVFGLRDLLQDSEGPFSWLSGE